MEKKYYLRNKERGFLGNSPIWWKKGGWGYSAYIENAEIWDEEKALQMVKDNPDKWEAVPCGFVNERLHTVFDWQDFEHLEQWEARNENKHRNN